MPSAEGTPRRARVPPSKPRPASSPKFVNGSGRSLPPVKRSPRNVVALVGFGWFVLLVLRVAVTDRG
jgi:hypothetical protein